LSISATSTSATTRRVQRTTHDQRSAGVALINRINRPSRSIGPAIVPPSPSRITAGHDDNNIDAVHGGAQVCYYMLDRSEPAGLTFHVKPLCADICKPRTSIVQSQLCPAIPSSAIR
jgi:hypothetical protein